MWPCPYLLFDLYLCTDTVDGPDTPDRPDTPEEELMWITRRFVGVQTLKIDAARTTHWCNTPTEILLQVVEKRQRGITMSRH